MPPWVLRGFGMGVLHAAAATALAKVAVYQPTDLLTIKVVMVAMLVGVAALWSALDGWLRREDRGRGWFIGGLVAGVFSGILYVIARAVFVDDSGVRELGPALTGGAAFTALLVLVPAGLGLLVGGRLKPPERKDLTGEPDEPRPSPKARHRPRRKPVG